MLDTFRSNFTQVAEQLIEMAKTKDRKKKKEWSATVFKILEGRFE